MIFLGKRISWAWDMCWTAMCWCGVELTRNSFLVVAEGFERFVMAIGIDLNTADDY